MSCMLPFSSISCYGKGGIPGNIEAILRESEMILNELRNRNLKAPLEGAERELKRAILLLEKIRAMLIDPEKSAELLKRLDRLHKVLIDFARIVQDQVMTPTGQANQLVAEGKRKYLLLLALLKDSDELAKQAQKNLDEAKRFLDLTRKCLADEALYLDQLPKQLIELNGSIHDIEVQRSILTQVNPDYQVRYVDKCREHKDMLVKKAMELDGLFNATRDVADYAIRAANVYKNIILAIEGAEKAAQRAYDAANEAYKKAVPDFDESLVDKARESKRKSLELLEKAKKLRDTEVERLSLELAKRKQLIDQLLEIVKKLMKDLDDINAGLKQLADKNLTEQLQEIDIILRRLMERIAEIHRRLKLLSDLIYGSIIPQYERLSAGSQSSLGNLTQVLDLARKDLMMAIKYASTSKKTLEEILKMEAKLDLDLDLLRRKIQLGHQSAASVHVSIMPGPEGQCTRSYYVPASLSAQEGGLSVAGFLIRHLLLTWSLHHDEPESLLLFVGSKTTDEFLAIEMYERRIRLVFNLHGISPAGTQILTHPRLIDLNDGGLLNDETWYQITMSLATDDQLKLNVKPFGSKSLGDKDSSVSQRLIINSISSSKLLTTPYGEADINFFVGGLPPGNEFTTINAIKSTRLTGCLYDLVLNHQHVGLWNFKTNQGCEGCMEGPQEVREMGTFSFSGSDSYANVSQIRPYDRTRYMMSLSFKTTDNNAVLFLTFSEASTHYFSVFLNRGKVCLLVGKLNPHQQSYTGLYSSILDHAMAAHQQALKSNNQSQVQPVEHLIQTNQEYNSGRWVKITAEKDQNRLVLVVDNEFKESIIDDKLLTLEMDQVFFGGVWPIIRPKKFTNSSLEFDSFAGCMKDIQLDTSPVDLLKKQSYGIDTGCLVHHSKRSLFLSSARVAYPLPAGR